MRLSYQWLLEFLGELPAPSELARRLTMGGIEVEGISSAPRAYGDTLVVARIESMQQHPNADRLTVCVVNDGAAQNRTIVCGARNMKAGDTVVLARPGCELPGGLTIKKSKLRGVDSEGMLCSAAELELPDPGEGILILEEGLAPGTEAAGLLGLDDTIFELGITPNRGDCLSVLGLARETAALCGLSLRVPAKAVEFPGGDGGVTVAIEDSGACPIYLGLVMRGVRVGPSPTWLRTRLTDSGVRSINNVVDVTNFVMMERGQPMHAFDLARLAEKRIVVRRARAGETIRTLDERDVTLDEEDLVIADARSPVAIAGVMGGALSAVSSETTDILLESAIFAPALVRRTSRRHGMLSDSSYRFERGIDTSGSEAAMLRAAALIAEIAGGQAGGPIVRGGAVPPPRSSVLVRPKRVSAIVGQSLSDDDVESVLLAVAAQPKPVADGFEAVPPPHRHDLEREIDFIEEVARIRGYDGVVPSMPHVELVPVTVPESVRVAKELRTLLAGLGMHEHVGVSFASEAANARFPGLFGDCASVLVRNPLRAGDTALQKSALGSLVAALEANVAVQEPRVDLFTIARTFAMSSEAQTDQREVVSGLLYGNRPLERPGQSRKLAFPDLKLVVEKVLGVLAPHTPSELEAACGRPEFHPGASAGIRLGGEPVGFLGRLHPDVAEGSNITGEIYLFEIDCRKTVEYRRAHPGLKPIARFPCSERDVSLLVDIAVPAGAAIRVVKEMDEACIETISVFDEYTGAGTGDGLKALGYRLVYRAADRTLTDAEVTALHEKVVSHLTGQLKARIRV